MSHAGDALSSSKKFLHFHLPRLSFLQTKNQNMPFTKAVSNNRVIKGHCSIEWKHCSFHGIILKIKISISLLLTWTCTCRQSGTVLYNLSCSVFAVSIPIKHHFSTVWPPQHPLPSPPLLRPLSPYSCFSTTSTPNQQQLSHLLLATGPTHPPDPTHFATQSSLSPSGSGTSCQGSHWTRNSPNSSTRPLRFPDSASPVTSGGARRCMALAALAVASSSMAPSLPPLASLKSSSPPPPLTHTSGTESAR